MAEIYSKIMLCSLYSVKDSWLILSELIGHLGKELPNFKQKI